MEIWRQDRERCSESSATAVRRTRRRAAIAQHSGRQQQQRFEKRQSGVHRKTEQPKGRSKSQRTGKANSARSAIGQQSTSRSSHPIKQSKAFMAFIKIQSSKRRKENYSLELGRQIKKEFRDAILR